MSDTPARNRGGRPVGSRNKTSRRLRTIFEKLEREEAISPALWIRRLHAIALGEAEDATVSESIAACDRLLRFDFGNPISQLHLEHEVGPSVEAILRRIAQSEQHRVHLEQLETRRRALPAVTTTLV